MEREWECDRSKNVNGPQIALISLFKMGYEEGLHHCGSIVVGSMVEHKFIHRLQSSRK
jgi:hypothetical protein